MVGAEVEYEDGETRDGFRCLSRVQLLALL